MSIKNFIDNSIPVGSNNSQETVQVHFTGAASIYSQVAFSRIGNMCMLIIPSMLGPSSGSGGEMIASNAIPSNYLPRDSFVVEGLTLNPDMSITDGYIQLTYSGNIVIGGFAQTGSGGDTIGLNNYAYITYISN